jgi:hypothetical protein
VATVVAVVFGEADVVVSGAVACDEVPGSIEDAVSVGDAVVVGVAGVRAVDVGAEVALEVGVDDVVVDDAAVVVDVEAVAATPQVERAIHRSPTAVGPLSFMWMAVTVSEPSGLCVCSL